MDFLGMMSQQAGMPMPPQPDPFQDVPLGEDNTNILDEMQLDQEIAQGEAEFEESLRKLAEPGEEIATSAKQDEEICELVLDKYRFAKDGQNDRRDKWINIIKAYRSELAYTVPVGVEEPESRIKTSLMGKHIDKMVNMNTMRMVQPYSNFIALKKRFSKQRSYKVANYLFNMFKDKQMAIEIIKAVKAAALFGVGFTKVIPDYSATMPEVVVEAVNNMDLFVDPAASSMRNMTFMIHRIYVPHDVVMARRGKGYRAKAVDAMIAFAKKRTGDDSTTANNELPAKAPGRILGKREPIKLRDADDSPLYSENDTGDDEIDSENESRFDRYKIYEYHDGKQIITIGEDRFVLQRRTNPIGLPFQAWFFNIPVSGEFWVKSHGEYLLPLQQEMDIKRNQRVLNINKLVNPTFLYTQQFGPADTLKLDSGGKFLCRDLEQARFLEQKNNTDMLLNEVQFIDSEAADRTNVTGVIQGSPAKKERMTTAESSAVYSQANMPFDFDTNIMTISGLIPMIRQILKTLSKILKPNPAFAADTPTGEGEPVEITATDFAEEFDIEVSISPTQEEKDKAKAMETYQTFSQDPYFDQIGLRQYLVPMIYPDFPMNLIIPPNVTQPAPNPTGSTSGKPSQ